MSGFSSLRLDGAANIEWRQGSTYSVVVDGPKQAVEDATIEVLDDTLAISQKPRADIRGKLTVTIQAPSAKRFELSGAGNLKASDLDCDKLTVELRGAGNATLKGKAKVVEVSVSGAGNVNAKDLKAESASVNLAGVGNVDVFASEDLNASVSGVGSVGYYGHPKNVSKSASGVGGVTDKG